MEVNSRVLGDDWNTSINAGERFETTQVSLIDHTALVADLKEKLCQLFNEYDSGRLPREQWMDSRNGVRLVR